MSENIDLNKVRRQLDSCLKLEVKPSQKPETEQEKRDREFAQQMTADSELESLSDRIMENDYIALQIQYDILEEASRGQAKRERSLILANDLLSTQASELKKQIFWERVLAGLTCAALMLGAIAAVVL